MRSFQLRIDNCITKYTAKSQKSPVRWVIIFTLAISDEKRRIPRIKNNAANIVYDPRDIVNKLSVAFLY